MRSRTRNSGHSGGARSCCAARCSARAGQGVCPSVRHRQGLAHRAATPAEPPPASTGCARTGRRSTQCFTTRSAHGWNATGRSTRSSTRRGSDLVPPIGLACHIPVNGIPDWRSGSARLSQGHTGFTERNAGTRPGTPSLIRIDSDCRRSVVRCRLLHADPPVLCAAGPVRWAADLCGCSALRDSAGGYVIELVSTAFLRRPWSSFATHRGSSRPPARR